MTDSPAAQSGFRDEWGTIVIGSGVGGLAAGAALARLGHAVLVLEQHYVAGGLTQTFSRAGYTWDVGVHYVGQAAPDQMVGCLAAWLSDGALRFAPLDAVYDTLHFPERFSVRLARGRAEFIRELVQTFPDSKREVEAFVRALDHAQRAGLAIFQTAALPPIIGRLVGLVKRRSIARWVKRTTAQVLDELVHDPRLRAALTATWGDHGGKPSEASFAAHATVMQHYLEGAHYPIDGAQAYAAGMVPVIERAGGRVQLRAEVRELILENDRVRGVRIGDGTVYRARAVVSDAGAQNTVALLPEPLRQSRWAQEILSFRPAPCHLCLYLGFEGDIAAAGADRSNHWFFDSWDTEASIWADPFGQPVAPGLVISFPSLRDPNHDPGPSQRHTAEVIAWTTWESFRQWQDSSWGSRPPEYQSLKDLIVERLAAQFARHFPRLAPLVRHRELSTPLSTAHFTHARQGAAYGLEVTPRRLLSSALRIRTPIRGLYLAGQDAVMPGTTPAMIGGVLAAAAIDPRVYRQLR
jgi:all-trans-retinol 13,14-reductase